MAEGKFDFLGQIWEYLGWLSGLAVTSSQAG